MDCPFSTMYNYLGEDGHCSRCPAYQDCNNAVAPVPVYDGGGERGEELRDMAREMGQGDWVVTSEEPV